LQHCAAGGQGRHSKGIYDTAQCNTYCNALQHTATHCNTLQHCNAGGQGRHSKGLYTSRHCNTHHNTLQHTATYCNTLQHPAAHLHHTAAHCHIVLLVGRGGLHTAKHSTTLQHTAKHYITLQLTAAHCNILQVVCGGSIQNVFECSTLQ